MTEERKVSYYYDPEIGNFYYGHGHPMKPHRVQLTNTLIFRYGLYKHLEVFTPVKATEEQLAAFHSQDYISFLKVINPKNRAEFKSEIRRYSVAADCPIFDRMFEYCQRYTGGSLGGAVRLNHGLSDIVINWAGGLHHAKKTEASGFCYINDIVLAILELLKYHHRVLYIDIDVHHGDGVEEAFLTTDRVMTVSFHKHGDNFFPGTGGLHDVGVGAGRHYTVNVPLKDGIDDDSYWYLFKPIMSRIMEVYQPGAIVLQSGADSLAHDKLGVFNLSIKGHAACHKFMASFGVPLLVLGGGGYKIKNVARCWTYETGILLGKENQMQDAIPPNEYYEYFGPDYNLHISSDKTLDNCNKRDVLEKMRNTVLESLRYVQPPGATFHERPPDAMDIDQVKASIAKAKTKSPSPSSDSEDENESEDEDEREKNDDESERSGRVARGSVGVSDKSGSIVAKTGNRRTRCSPAAEQAVVATKGTTKQAGRKTAVAARNGGRKTVVQTVVQPASKQEESSSDDKGEAESEESGSESEEEEEEEENQGSQKQAVQQSNEGDNGDDGDDNDGSSESGSESNSQSGSEGDSGGDDSDGSGSEDGSREGPMAEQQKASQSERSDSEMGDQHSGDEASDEGEDDDDEDEGEDDDEEDVAMEDVQTDVVVIGPKGARPVQNSSEDADSGSVEGGGSSSALESDSDDNMDEFQGGV